MKSIKLQAPYAWIAAWIFGFSSLMPRANAEDTPEDAVRNTVQAWNQALDQHDLAALANLYADPVKLYGKSLSKNAAIAAKRSALKAAPDYHQSVISPVKVETDEKGYLASFTKRSGGAKAREVQARLLINNGLIVEESDAPSDQLAAKVTPAETCEEAASRIVHNLPAVRSILTEAQKTVDRARDGRVMAGIGPEPDEGGGFSARLGVNGPERFEILVDYAVDNHGALTVEVQAETVSVPSADQNELTSICAKK